MYLNRSMVSGRTGGAGLVLLAAPVIKRGSATAFAGRGLGHGLAGALRLVRWASPDAAAILPAKAHGRQPALTTRPRLR